MIVSGFSRQGANYVLLLDLLMLAMLTDFVMELVIGFHCRVVRDVVDRLLQLVSVQKIARCPSRQSTMSTLLIVSCDD